MRSRCSGKSLIALTRSVRPDLLDLDQGHLDGAEGGQDAGTSCLVGQNDACCDAGAVAVVSCAFSLRQADAY